MTRAWFRRLALLPLIGLLAAAGDPSTPESRLQIPLWAQHFQLQQTLLRSNHYDLIFLGDSITRELDTSGQQPWADIRAVWERWFACHRAIELGYSGDTTANLLWRIENGGLPATPPKAAVVLIGTNNNRAVLGWSGEATAAAIVLIVRELHRRLPGTRIVVLGVPPNGHGPVVNGKIDATNARLAAADWAALNATFVPTKDLFAPGGQLDLSLFREPHDGRPALHPDQAGWEKMAELLAPVLAAAGGWPAGPCPGAPSLPQ